MVTAPIKYCTELVLSVSAFYLKVKTWLVRFSLLTGISTVNNCEVLCSDYIIDIFPKPGLLCCSLAQRFLPRFLLSASRGTAGATWCCT